MCVMFSRWLSSTSEPIPYSSYKAEKEQFWTNVSMMTACLPYPVGCALDGEAERSRDTLFVKNLIINNKCYC